MACQTDLFQFDMLSVRACMLFGRIDASAQTRIFNFGCTLYN